jgi:hypothetical protein
MHADGTQGRIITSGRPVRLPDNIRVSSFSHIMLFDKHGSVRVLVTFDAEGEDFWPGVWAGRLLQVRSSEASR